MPSPSQYPQRTPLMISMIPFAYGIRPMALHLDKKYQLLKNRRCKMYLLIWAASVYGFGFVTLPMYYVDQFGDDEKLALLFCGLLASITLSLVFFYHCPACFIKYKHWNNTLITNFLIHLSILATGIAVKYSVRSANFPFSTLIFHCLHIIFFGNCTADIWIVFNNGIRLRWRTPIDISGEMEQEMEVQVLDVSNLSGRSSKPSCELCFLVKASPMGCGHIICHKCLEEFMLTNNVVGTTCPICEAMKSYVEVTRTGRRSTSEAITDQPGPSEPTENCKLCTKPVYAKPTSHKALRDCGHYTCYDCLQQFPDQITGSTFPCPFCRHCGILNGKSSGRQKRKTRAKMDETKIQGSGVDEPFVFPKLEDLKL